MTTIIWMTDPHFQNEGLVDDLNPRTRLKAAIAHMNAHHADADFMVLTGDLVGDDIEGDYRLLATYLAESKIPVYPLVGNNDDRAGFRAHLTLPENTMDDFIQYRVDTPDATILCLDTHMVGSHAGQFCAARQEWLAAHLGDTPTYVFMHHPPMDLHLSPQDEIKLADADAFLDLIANDVDHLFIGHVHRPTCGTIRGIPFATLRALSFQAPPPQPPWDWSSFVPAKEAPHYGVIYIENGNVTLQHTDFCAYETGIER
ncbi:MAG: metallophosphoesterase [Pseudomonadota bacterium]